MYKRMIALMLVVFFALSLAACGNNVQPADPTDVEEPTEVTSEPIPGLEDYDGDVNLDDSNGDEPTEGTDPTAKPENPTEATNPKTEDPKDVTTPSEEATEPTEETPPSEEVTEPTEETTPSEETVPPTEGGNQGSAGKTAYEDYINMTGEQQLAFMQSFDSMEAFFAWLNAAKAEYEAQNPGTDVGDGNIDLSGGN